MIEPRKRVKLALATAARYSGLIRRRRRGLIVLMLHKVNDEPDVLQLTIRPALLDAMLEELLRYGECIPFDAVDEAVLNDVAPRFCITFDDGYRDNFTDALPVLRKYRVPATVFLATDYIDTNLTFWYEELEHFLRNGKPGRLDLAEFGLGEVAVRDDESWITQLYALNTSLKSLSAAQRGKAVASIGRQLAVEVPPEGSPILTWDEIREMRQSDITFGSHTASHPILSRERRNTIRDELTRSKAAIESHLGIRIDTLAYPNGTRDDYNDVVIDEARAAGYRLACTTVEEACNGNTSHFEVGRMHVHSDMCTGINGQFAPDFFWCKILQIL